MLKQKIVRSYQIPLYATRSKKDDLKWMVNKYTELVNQYLPKHYFSNYITKYEQEKKNFLVEGLGHLGSQAQRKAKGIVKSKKSNEQNNNHNKSLPFLSKKLCYAKIQPAEVEHFDYAITLYVSFGPERAKTVYLFANRTKPLKDKLKQGFELSSQCELHQGKDGKWYAIVSVSKEIPYTFPKKESIGVDVGITHIISTSEGFTGDSVSKLLKREKNSQRERSRQCAITFRRYNKDPDNEKLIHLTKILKKNRNKSKTKIKQLLDKEAHRMICRAVKVGKNLSVEDPLVLANLSRHNRWAKSYFANRLRSLGEEFNVFVVFVNPAYTSKICSNCGEKESVVRSGVKFECNKSCMHKMHADVNASINISRKGQESIDKFIIPTILKKINARNDRLKSSSETP